eukprot:TRINITY_DN26076_c0_g1_i1.p1 TRINITY_DN26076_c0_g1~~TRINITY_DN26076_c0_g1_i1.p1  ORF type:complete len:109 (-),score=2.54 TRINITY_DN26076_c0_g1_i1:12-338(-)
MKIQWPFTDTGSIKGKSIRWRVKDGHHREGVIERKVATFKYVLKAKKMKGHAPRLVLKLTAVTVNRGVWRPQQVSHHTCWSTGKNTLQDCRGKSRTKRQSFSFPRTLR